MSLTLQSALKSGHEASIVQIDFGAAFDRVNQQGILYKFNFVGIVGSVLSILILFLSNRSLHLMVGGCSEIWLKLCQECSRAVSCARH